MKSKAAKYIEPPNTLDSKSPPLQCPVTRNKGRSSQVNSVRSQSSSVLDQSSSERNKMQHSQENSVGSITSPVVSHGTLESSKVQSSQENSMIARASSVLSQTAYDSSKTQNTQENPVGSKAVPSQSTCDSSRQIHDDGSSNSDLCLMPAKEVEQVSQLDLPSSRTSGSVSVGTNVTTLTGNRLTIKSGTKEVVVVFMNSSQSVGCGGQTTENNQEHEIRATTKSVPAASTTTAPNTVDERFLLSNRQEMPLHSTCHTTANEASIINESISCENNSTFKIRDASGDQVNDDSYHHSFQKLERPMPIILHAHRPLLSATINGPQTSMGVGANGAVLEQNTISSDENPVDNRRCCAICNGHFVFSFFVCTSSGIVEKKVESISASSQR
ncbi:uncharacterized protein LOC126455777 [Schistocerca serialis cubense]|uniref:uncharacterized protein LOC126455777 n=1 Tax=Schistocerca serialis cubense TaxID=2023355 RepID=UPI00214F08EC|nr:uncharacterized protein LOC126455777 [Schistocerca serialis cubense]